jgi:hypothetical protein
MLSEAREALAADTASAGFASEQQQLMERLLSHHEAGTSASGSEGCTPDPSPQHQLRAQKIALSLLSRGVRLPQSVLDSVGNVAKSRAVRACCCRQCMTLTRDHVAASAGALQHIRALLLCIKNCTYQLESTRQCHSRLLSTGHFFNRANSQA